MRFPGFIGAAYVLDSVNVDSQACVNLYPEKIESGHGKEGEMAFLRSTPGLTKILSVGTGPIRCEHVDSIGRIFVVSGNQLFRIQKSTDSLIHPVIYIVQGITQSSGTINTSNGQITAPFHNYYTGLPVLVKSDTTIPGGLTNNTTYYIIVVDANTVKLATTLANALSNISPTLFSVGTGTLTLSPFGGSVTVTLANINISTGVFTATSHGFLTGEQVQFATLPTSPGSLAYLTNYYVIKVDANNFTLASSVANASAGTSISLTSMSGPWNITLVGASGLEGGTPVAFATSTGRVKAASFSSLNEGTDSSTLFVDGAQMMSFFDFGQNSTNQFNALATFTNTVTSSPYSTVDTATDVTWIDGYFLVNEGGGSNKFFASDILSFNFNALEFASAEGAPDTLLAVESSYRNLCLFADRTTEVFADTGNANFPFERIQGGFVEIGIMAPYSVGKFDDGTLLWLGRSERGAGIVYASYGLTPQRVSTYAIERTISGYSDASSATAFTYQSNGHSFYVLNFSESTWVFDLATSTWHERAYTNNGVLERHRADFCVYAPSLDVHLVGDYSNNNIYQFDDSVYSDNGTAITRLRSSPHLSEDMNRVFCSKFQLDMETGIGLDGGVQGSSPTVMLDFSDDGGHTFSSESFALADAGSGLIGHYKTRVIWRRLGSFRDRIFRVKITDPVKVVLLGATMDLEPGDS